MVGFGTPIIPKPNYLCLPEWTASSWFPNFVKDWNYLGTLVDHSLFALSFCAFNDWEFSGENNVDFHECRKCFNGYSSFGTTSFEKLATPRLWDRIWSSYEWDKYVFIVATSSQRLKCEFFNSHNIRPESYFITIFLRSFQATALIHRTIRRSIWTYHLSNAKTMTKIMKRDIVVVLVGFV